MTRGRLLVAGAAVVLATAALLMLAPGFVPASLTAVVSRIATVLGPGRLAVLAGLVVLGQRLLTTNAPVVPPSMPVDGADDAADEDRVVGEQFDQRLAAAARVDGRSAEAEAMVRRDLRRLATDCYQRVHGCDRETAARAVENGTWTDDTATAAFVGGTDAPTMPLRVWFRDVLSEEGAFSRGVTRTIRALYTLDDDVNGEQAVPPAFDEALDRIEPPTDGTGGRGTPGSDATMPEVDD